MIKLWETGLEHCIQIWRKTATWNPIPWALGHNFPMRQVALELNLWQMND